MTLTVRVLVVGTYPPIPLPSAAVAVEAVQAAWAAGHDVTVVSPRPSAAPMMVPIAGPLAGRRLDRARRLSGATRVVLVVESGFPVPAGSRLGQTATVAGLIRALHQFERVEIRFVGRTALPGPLETRLRRAADEVSDFELSPAGRHGAAGVTPLGPVETRKRDIPAKVAKGVVYRALGPETGQRLAAGAARLTRGVRRVAGGTRRVTATTRARWTVRRR